MLDKVGLLEVRERMANKLSGGMKRRLGIAQALIGNPRLLVIDEPTTGLDPEEMVCCRQQRNHHRDACEALQAQTGACMELLSAFRASCLMRLRQSQARRSSLGT